jgi:predicted O-methyltransferase YrrM
MARRTMPLTEALHDYMLDVSLREPDVLRRLREETVHHAMAECQIAPEQGQFMALLVKLIAARRTLEIGTFTGYSAAWVALALPVDGQVIACDVSEKWTAVARRYWREAGIAGRIDLRLAPAVETLEKLVETGQEDSFDFAFIDADKPNYDAYYEYCLRLVRPGGLIALDNTLAQGRVVESTGSEYTRAIKALNEKLHADARVDISLVPIADGLTLARRR